MINLAPLDGGLTPNYYSYVYGSDVLRRLLDDAQDLVYYPDYVVDPFNMWNGEIRGQFYALR